MPTPDWLLPPHSFPGLLRLPSKFLPVQQQQASHQRPPDPLLQPPCTTVAAAFADSQPLPCPSEHLQVNRTYLLLLHVPFSIVAVVSPAQLAAPISRSLHGHSSSCYANDMLLPSVACHHSNNHMPNFVLAVDCSQSPLRQVQAPTLLAPS